MVKKLFKMVVNVEKLLKMVKNVDFSKFVKNGEMLKNVGENIKKVLHLSSFTLWIRVGKIENFSVSCITVIT